jgi:hypothetical protein
VPLEALVTPIEHARLTLERAGDGAREPEPVDVEREIARHDDLARDLGPDGGMTSHAGFLAWSSTGARRSSTARGIPAYSSR